jgi:restriction system protein
LLRGKNLDQLLALSPQAFEEWVAARFRDLRYTTRLTESTGDHGVDILAQKDGKRAVVQCKRYVGTVGEPVRCGTVHTSGGCQRTSSVAGAKMRRAQIR